MREGDLLEVETQLERERAASKRAFAEFEKGFDNGIIDITQDFYFGLESILICLILLVLHPGEQRAIIAILTPYLYPLMMVRILSADSLMMLGLRTWKLLIRINSSFVQMGHFVSCLFIILQYQQEKYDTIFPYTVIILIKIGCRVIMTLQLRKMFRQNRQPRFYHQKHRICRDLWLFFVLFQIAPWIVNPIIPHCSPRNASFSEFFLGFELLGLLSSAVRCVSFSCSKDKTFEVIYFQMAHTQYIRYFTLGLYNNMPTYLLGLVLLKSVIFLIFWIKFSKKILRIYYWDTPRESALQISSTSFIYSFFCLKQQRKQFFKKANLFDKLKVSFQEQLCYKCCLRKIDLIWSVCMHASFCSKCIKEMRDKNPLDFCCPICSKFGSSYFFKILPNSSWLDYWSTHQGLSEDEARIKNEYFIELVQFNE